MSEFFKVGNMGTVSIHAIHKISKESHEQCKISRWESRLEKSEFSSGEYIFSKDHPAVPITEAQYNRIKKLTLKKLAQ